MYPGSSPVGSSTPSDIFRYFYLARVMESRCRQKVAHLKLRAIHGVTYAVSLKSILHEQRYTLEYVPSSIPENIWEVRCTLLCVCIYINICQGSSRLGAVHSLLLVGWNRHTEELCRVDVSPVILVGASFCVSVLE